MTITATALPVAARALAVSELVVALSEHSARNAISLDWAYSAKTNSITVTLVGYCGDRASHNVHLATVLRAANFIAVAHDGAVYVNLDCAMR